MVTVDLSVFPVGKGEHLSKKIAQVLDIIDKSNVKYQFGPMGTTLTGEWDEVFALVKKCFKAAGKDASRVYGTLKIDCSFKGKKAVSLGSRLQKVQKHLGRKLVVSA